MKPRFLLLLSGLCTVGLTSCATLSHEQVRSERTSYNAIAPDYLRYVNEDPRLSLQQKTSRQRLVEEWDRRIREIETDVQ